MPATRRGVGRTPAGPPRSRAALKSLATGHGDGDWHHWQEPGGPNDQQRPLHDCRSRASHLCARRQRSTLSIPLPGCESRAPRPHLDPVNAHATDAGAGAGFHQLILLELELGLGPCRAGRAWPSRASCRVGSKFLDTIGTSCRAVLARQVYYQVQDGPPDTCN